MSRFKVELAPSDESVRWSHPDVKGSLNIALDDIVEEHREASAAWFTVKGMQVHLEQRTSQDMAEGPDVTLKARLTLWQNICAVGHEYKEPREGGIGTVSAEVQALANLKGVAVSAIQKKRKEYSKEKWAKMLQHPDIQAEAEKVRAERAEAEEVELDEFES